MLLRIPNGVSKVPNCFINSVSPAFDAPYAKPAIASRLKPAMLLVQVTWDFWLTFPLAFPASSRRRKARTEKKTEVALTLNALVKACGSVAHSVSCSWASVGFEARFSMVGPVVPALAQRRLMKPSCCVMCTAALRRSSLLVTSPWRGKMFPCC
jgi:hypothetical protein